MAEDNRGDVLLVKRALLEPGIQHELSIAQDGAEAAALIAEMGKLAAICPDLMLLDLNLPKLDGQQILRRFRQQPECADIPVIVVTSSDAPEDRSSMSALGVDYYFRKPSDFDAFMKLGAVIREIVGK